MKSAKFTRAARRAVVVAMLLVITAAGCSPPQMFEDEKNMQTVDALYTAVTSHDIKLVERCEKDLRGLKEAGKLSEPAFESLEKVIVASRHGDWKPAVKELNWIVKGQRPDRST